MREKTRRAMDTKCEKDYKDRHRWGKLGVVRDKMGFIFLIHQCSQCKKCVSEELEFLIQ